MTAPEQAEAPDSKRSPLAAAVMRAVSGFSGDVGVCAIHASSGRRILFHADRMFPAASTVKLFVLVALYQASAQGKLDLERRMEVTNRDRCKGSGVLAHLDDGLRPTLRDLATLMMMVSDNTAANLLIDVIGVERIRDIIEKAGLEHTRFEGPIDFTVFARDQSAMGSSTPLDMARFMMRLYKNELLPAEETARVINVLRIQKYIEPMRRMLPVDPYARELGEPEPVWVASKTGSLDGVRVEVGLVHADGHKGKRHKSGRATKSVASRLGPWGNAWALSVMTNRGSERRVSSENEAVRIIAQVSRAVFDAWSV